jgi:hypothetical protein
MPLLPRPARDAAARVAAAEADRDAGIEQARAEADRRVSAARPAATRPGRSRPTPRRRPLFEEIAAKVVPVAVPDAAS